MLCRWTPVPLGCRFDFPSREVVVSPVVSFTTSTKYCGFSLLDVLKLLLVRVTPGFPPVDVPLITNSPVFVCHDPPRSKSFLRSKKIFYATNIFSFFFKETPEYRVFFGKM